MAKTPKGATDRHSGKATPIGSSKSHVQPSRKAALSKASTLGKKSERFEPNGQLTKTRTRGR